MERAGNADAIDSDSTTLSCEKMVLGGDVLVHAPVRSTRAAIEASPGKWGLVRRMHALLGLQTPHDPQGGVRQTILLRARMTRTGRRAKARRARPSWSAGPGAPPLLQRKVVRFAEKPGPGGPDLTALGSM